MRALRATLLSVIWTAMLFSGGCSSSNDSVSDNPGDSRELRDTRRELADARDRIKSLEDENERLRDDLKKRHDDDDDDGVKVRVKW